MLTSQILENTDSSNVSLNFPAKKNSDSNPHKSEGSTVTFLRKLQSGKTLRKKEPKNFLSFTPGQSAAGRLHAGMSCSSVAMFEDKTQATTFCTLCDFHLLPSQKISLNNFEPAKKSCVLSGNSSNLSRIPQALGKALLLGWPRNFKDHCSEAPSGRIS